MKKFRRIVVLMMLFVLGFYNVCYADLIGGGSIPNTKPVVQEPVNPFVYIGIGLFVIIVVAFTVFVIVKATTKKKEETNDDNK